MRSVAHIHIQSGFVAATIGLRRCLPSDSRLVRTFGLVVLSRHAVCLQHFTRTARTRQ